MHLPDKNYKPASFLLLLFILFDLVKPDCVSAQQEIPDSLVKERILSIQQILEDGRKNTNIWWYGWLAAYSAATVVQGTVYFTSHEEGTQQDMALGAATSLLGAVGQFITPLHPGHKAKILSEIPDSTVDQRLEKLLYAEKSLKNIAANERYGRSWKTHALFGAINVSSGLITWLGFKRSVWAGIENFAINMAISEAQIWTQPLRTKKDYENYCRKYKEGVKPYAYKAKPEFYVSTYPGGISFRMTF